MEGLITDEILEILKELVFAFRGVNRHFPGQAE
jgi:hypothetical protein